MNNTNRNIIILLILASAGMILTGITNNTSLQNRISARKPVVTPTDFPTFKPRTISKSGDLLLFQNKEYKIFHFLRGNVYQITIISTDYNQTRKKAEQHFLRLTSFTQSQACQETVVINTPYYINPDVEDQRLSFCR